jgi:hypothetical protein
MRRVEEQVKVVASPRFEPAPLAWADRKGSKAGGYTEWKISRKQKAIVELVLARHSLASLFAYET